MTEAILLTKRDCGLCDHAKDVLARVSAEHPLYVKEISLETEEGRVLGLRAGAPFPPVLLLDGQPFSYGRLSERRLRKALR